MLLMFLAYASVSATKKNRKSNSSDDNRMYVVLTVARFYRHWRDVEIESLQEDVQ
jgi:hypothetical protein